MTPRLPPFTIRSPEGGVRSLSVGRNQWVALVALAFHLCAGAVEAPKPRVIVETDLGGDPDDEQSMVRFLLYANELDIEGIIANRAVARNGENLNPERTGIGILRRFADAYEACWAYLNENDVAYPRPSALRERMVDGTEKSQAGVDLIIRAVDARDSRPVWFCNWGTDAGSAPSNLLRALDRVRLERGDEGYAVFKRKLRLSSYDKFGPHTRTLQPAFPLWVDTFNPTLGGKRWYHQFSALTAGAGEFNLTRDARQEHGPLGALYPVNTKPPQKEGDTMTFLHLIPNGLNEPEHPEWGGWAGRYLRQSDDKSQAYYHATGLDVWNGQPPSRDATLARWAEAIQMDFKARLDWCVSRRGEANHPPQVRLRGERFRPTRPGQLETVDASLTSDPDRNEIRYDWFWYPEAGTYAGSPPVLDAQGPLVSLEIPAGDSTGSLHLILAVTDQGNPPLTRYARVVFEIRP